MSEPFRPKRPPRFPIGGATVAQIEFYEMLTDPNLDQRALGRALAPAMAGAQFLHRDGSPQEEDGRR